MSVPDLSRRELLALGGVAAGGLLLPANQEPKGKLKAHHVFSLIGEFSIDGGYVSSKVAGRDATNVDLAVSVYPDMSNAVFVGAQPVDPTTGLVRHDMDGLLTPGSQYYARLAVESAFFGRILTWRTQAADPDQMNLRIALLSCQRIASTATKGEPGWAAIKAYEPDLLLHGGDFGYWDGYYAAADPYTKHVAAYATQILRCTRCATCSNQCAR